MKIKYVNGLEKWYFIIAILIAVTTMFFFFDGSLTDVSGEEGNWKSYQDSLNLIQERSGEQTFVVGGSDGSSLKSLKLSGKIIGDGNVRVYLKNENGRYLVFEDETVESSGLNSITGFAVSAGNFEELDSNVESDGSKNGNSDNKKNADRGNSDKDKSKDVSENKDPGRSEKNDETSNEAIPDDSISDSDSSDLGLDTSKKKDVEEPEQNTIGLPVEESNPEQPIVESNDELTDDLIELPEEAVEQSDEESEPALQEPINEEIATEEIEEESSNETTLPTEEQAQKDKNKEKSDKNNSEENKDGDETNNDEEETNDGTGASETLIEKVKKKIKEFKSKFQAKDEDDQEITSQVLNRGEEIDIEVGKTENFDKSMGWVKLLNVKKNDENKDVKVKIGKIEDDVIKSEVIAIDNVDAEKTLVSLPKTDDVNTIFYCEDFDYDNFQCLGEWEETNISFVDNGDHIEFEMDETFSEGNEFEELCTETCLLPSGLNPGEYTLEFEIENGTKLELDEVDYMLEELTVEGNVIE